MTEDEAKAINEFLNTLADKQKAGSKKKPNPNHPKSGAKIDIHPLRNESDIKTMLRYLSGNPRNCLLFVMGINTGIRITDLLPLKVADLRYLEVGQVHQIIENKTGKKNQIVINKSVRNALDKFIQEKKPADRDFLFQSAKKDKHGNYQPIKIEHVNKMIKNWTRAIKLDPSKYGARTLRKTWGYQQRVKFGAGWELIAKRYNHSSPAVTRRYLGFESKEVNEILMNDIC